MISEKEECERESITRKCEIKGNFYYPTCKPGYHNEGCCACVPNDYLDSTSVDFEKIVYYRELGKMMRCDQNEEYDQKGLCYPQCQNGFLGIGSVCWAQCPKHMKQCGPFCISKFAKCHHQILKKLGEELDLSIANGIDINHQEISLRFTNLIQFVAQHCSVTQVSPKKCQSLMQSIPGAVKGKEFKLQICNPLNKQ